jgi:hypothetical protein
MLTLSTGLAAGGGELLRWTCTECGWQGQPLLFESTQERDAFRAERRPGGILPKPSPVPGPSEGPVGVEPDRPPQRAAGAIAVLLGGLILAIGFYGLVASGNLGVGTLIVFLGASLLAIALVAAGLRMMGRTR